MLDEIEVLLYTIIPSFMYIYQSHYFSVLWLNYHKGRTISKAWLDTMIIFVIHVSTTPWSNSKCLSKIPTKANKSRCVFHQLMLQHFQSHPSAICWMYPLGLGKQFIICKVIYQLVVDAFKHVNSYQGCEPRGFLTCVVHHYQCIVTAQKIDTNIFYATKCPNIITKIPYSQGIHKKPNLE